MASAGTWPASLPQRVLLNFSQTQKSNRVRTAMDVSIAKQRRRFSAVEWRIQAVIKLTDAQLDTFWTFYDTTLAGGALTFDWVLPSDDSAAELRFVGEPKEVASTASVATVSLDLESLPT